VGTIPVRVQGIKGKCQPTLASDTYLASNLEEIERSAYEAIEAVRESLMHLRTIDLEPVQVAASVAAAVEAAEPPRGVHIRTEHLDALPAVVAGEQSLTLVFTNLIENAVQAMAGEGTVSIQGTSADGWVALTVSDSGPGIAPELQGRVFDFDFSGHSSSRPSLGFGLWWVRTLVVRLGGSVGVESDGRHGTTFRLRLPSATRPI
jgi:signal transduction histidine kinase